MGILNGAKEQLKWGNLKYLGGYPNKTIPFICGLYKDDGKIEIHGGAVWGLQFSILKKDILSLEIRDNKILMKINFENAEIELRFAATNNQLAYNKMTTLIYQENDTPTLNKKYNIKQDSISDNEYKLEEDNNSDNKVKFYNKSWFMWTTLIFFAPVGIFLMWKNKRFNKLGRVVASIVFGLLFMVAININSDSNSQSSKKSVETAKAVTEQKEKTPEEIKKEAEAKAKADAEAKAKADAKAIEDAKIAKQNAYKTWVEGQFSAWDGSHRALVDLIKENLNDKKSFEHEKTTYIDKGDYLIIKMVYRAKNAFGGVILQNVTAKSDYKTNTLSIISVND